MSQQPKTETDRLANVIQVLQLGQKTGRLIVERENGPQFEQGIITFVNGQVVQAGLNQIQGPDAFNQLKSWGTCRFAFTPEQRASSTGRIPALPPSPPPAPSPWQPGWRETDNQASSTPPLRSGPSPLRNPTSSLRNRSSGSSPLSRQAPVPGYTQENIYSRTTRDLGGTRQPTPTAWLATPYRTRHMEEGMHLIEQMGLSRTHRRLFLLIDGGRTVKELIRLMSQNPEDVQRLLYDLERAGVIQL
ncbi:MAG TPA: DUF4388 domain-containing protein [Ktedonobacteraceae bacterium]